MEMNILNEIMKIKKHYEDHNDIVRGILFEREIKFIQETLNLKESSETQISNVYNMANLYFDNELLVLRLNDNLDVDKYFQIQDCKSAIQTVINCFVEEARN